MRGFEFYRRFLSFRSPIALANRLSKKKSEKTIYSYSMPPDSPFHRANPIDEVKITLEAFREADEKLFRDAANYLLENTGYEVTKIKIQPEYISPSTILKETSEASLMAVKNEEDGKITKEEANAELKEIEEAQDVLERRKVFLMEKLKKRGKHA